MKKVARKLFIGYVNRKCRSMEDFRKKEYSVDFSCEIVVVLMCSMEFVIFNFFKTFISTTVRYYSMKLNMKQYMTVILVKSFNTTGSARIYYFHMG